VSATRKIERPLRESAMWTIRGDRLLTVLFLTYSQLIYRAATGRSATIGAGSTEHSALRTTH